MTSEARASWLASIACSVVLAGCSAAALEDFVAREQLPPASIVRLSPERAVHAQPDGDAVEVIELRVEDGAWIEQKVARFGNGRAASSLNLLSYGGETGDEWNTFIYGTAPDGVRRVEVIGYDGEGGHVVNGAWVIALPNKDLTPNDVHWRFLDGSGALVDSGVGIFPPSS